MIDNMATNSMLLLHSQQPTLGIPTSLSMPGAIGASATFPPGVTWTQPAHGDYTLRCTFSSSTLPLSLNALSSNTLIKYSHQILSSNTLIKYTPTLIECSLTKYSHQIYSHQVHTCRYTVIRYVTLTKYILAGILSSNTLSLNALSLKT